MRQVFEILPPSGSSFTIVTGSIIGVIGILLGLFAYIAWTSSHGACQVSSEGLRIRGGLYGRTIPLADLALAEAKPVDLAAQSEYALSARTNGIGLPGYSAGWFRMRNGGKALAFVTDKSRVARIPTRRDYTILVSVPSPGALLDALRASAR